MKLIILGENYDKLLTIINIPDKDNILDHIVQKPR